MHDQRGALWQMRTAQKPDLDQVVSVHMASFPGFFLTFLGPRFLRLFYESLNSDKGGVLLVVELDGRIVGFVAGVTQQSGFYGRLIRRRIWAFALAATSAISRRPTIVVRLTRALGKARDRGPVAAACLMSIAVRPESASLGLGARLVEGFSEEMGRHGVDRYCLTTDRDGNDRVNAFYQRLGFFVSRTYRTPEGRWMNEYVKELEEK